MRDSIMPCLFGSIDASLQMLIYQHAALVILSFAVAITVSVCFIAIQWRKARQADAALVLGAAILSKQSPRSETQSKLLMQAAHSSELSRQVAPVPESNNRTLLSKLLFVLLVLLSFPVLVASTCKPQTLPPHYYPPQSMKPYALPLASAVNNTGGNSNTSITAATLNVPSQTAKASSVPILRSTKTNAAQ
jgi:hypothetical protein